MLFKNMQILAFDYTCAEETAKIYKTLKFQGQLIEVEDLLIAAVALRYQIPLATSPSVKHFERASRLILVKPF